MIKSLEFISVFVYIASRTTKDMIDNISNITSPNNDSNCFISYQSFF